MKTILHAEGFLKDSFCFYLSQTLHLLKYEFELSMNNGFRVIQKGHDSSFEGCHALLSHITMN